MKGRGLNVFTKWGRRFGLTNQPLRSCDFYYDLETFQATGAIRFIHYEVDVYTKSVYDFTKINTQAVS